MAELLLPSFAGDGMIGLAGCGGKPLGRCSTSANLKQLGGEVIVCMWTADAAQRPQRPQI